MPETLDCREDQEGPASLCVCLICVLGRGGALIQTLEGHLTMFISLFGHVCMSEKDVCAAGPFSAK